MFGACLAFWCCSKGDGGGTTAPPDPATQIEALAGNAQHAVVGTSVGTPPSVLVRDAKNHAVAGVAVRFTITAGGGSIASEQATTGSDGVASVGSWTLGATPGVNTLAASSDGLTGSPVTFSALGTLASPPAVTVDTNNGRTCAVAVDGKAYCWGEVEAYRTLLTPTEVDLVQPAEAPTRSCSM